MDESVRGNGTSFSDYIRYTSESEDATEAFGLATAYTKLRVVALNMALSAGIGLVVSYFSKKIIEAAQRVDKLAESSKEAADAATSTTSSLNELVDEYEKLVDATNDSHNAAWQAVQKYEQSPLTDAVPSAGFLLVVWALLF